MNPREWLFAAFILTVLWILPFWWLCDLQKRREMEARQSIEAVKVSLTPFERDRARAIDKAKQAGIDPRWVEGGK